MAADRSVLFSEAVESRSDLVAVVLGVPLSVIVPYMAFRGIALIGKSWIGLSIVLMALAAYLVCTVTGLVQISYYVRALLKAEMNVRRYWHWLLPMLWILQASLAMVSASMLETCYWPQRGNPKVALILLALSQILQFAAAIPLYNNVPLQSELHTTQSIFAMFIAWYSSAMCFALVLTI